MPTSRDIPPVTLTSIRHVEPSVFKDYITRFEGLFDVFESARLEAEDESTHDVFARRDRGLAPYGRRKTSGSIPGKRTAAPLASIPSVYLEENFRLENPRVFDVVSEHAKIVWQPQFLKGHESNGLNEFIVDGNPLLVRKPLATNAILQEKLSWYLDTVEVHVINAISQVSASFFTALSSIREVYAEAADSVTKIQKLRKDLAYLDKEMALPGLHIISLKRRRDNVVKMGEAIKQLQCVLNGASHCEELVDSGQLDTAMYHIWCVEQLAAGTLDTKIDGLHWLLPTPHVGLADLRQLHALDGPLRAIDQLRLRIGKGYATQLINILLSDLRRHVSHVPSRDTLVRWADAPNRFRAGTDTPSSLPAYALDSEKLREEVASIVQRLGQSQYLDVANNSLREAVIREMKSLIRKHLPNSSEDDNISVTSASTRTSGRRPTQQERSRTLTRNLRALSAKDAEAFYVKVYYGIVEALRRLRVQVKTLLDITSRIKDVPVDVPALGQRSDYKGDLAVATPDVSIGCDLQEETAQILDLSSLLEQAADKAQSETVKVLRVRSEQTIRLGLADFLGYLTLNRLFVNECEAISGHSGSMLNHVVNSQTEEYIPRLHEMERQRLAQRMEIEKWEPIEFKTEDALLLEHIIQSATSDPTAWLSYTDARNIDIEAGGLKLHEDGSPSPSANAATQHKKRPASAVIEEEAFILVESAAFALRGIEPYTILLVSVPSMAKEISLALHDYLKLYSSRTQQLILGAGAKLTAGLTNINTKHLALALQSLSFFSALIPYLQEYVRRRPFLSGSPMAEFERLKREYQDHQSSIHDKLIDIMSNRATICTRAMDKIKWDDENEIQRKVSPHLETLTKEALTLQRVLSKYLPALSVNLITGRVFASFKKQLSEAFDGAEAWTEAGQARLLRDAELVEAKLGKINGAEELGAQMINIVKAKQIASRLKASESSPASRATP